MMPPPAIRQLSDVRHSGWFSTRRASAYHQWVIRASVAPPILFGNATAARCARHPHPSFEAWRSRRTIQSYLAQPDAAAKSP
jgi:hypothetical protein